MKPKVLPAHRLAAADLIWRSFDRPFPSESEYQLVIDQVANLLALGRAVVFVRRGNFMHMISPHLKKKKL